MKPSYIEKLAHYAEQKQLEYLKKIPGYQEAFDSSEAVPVLRRVARKDAEWHAVNEQERWEDSPEAGSLDSDSWDEQSQKVYSEAYNKKLAELLGKIPEHVETPKFSRHKSSVLPTVGAAIGD